MSDTGVVAGGRGSEYRPLRRRPSRRRRLLTRSGPVVVIAVAAFAAGATVATGPGRSERRLATEYVTDWTHGDVAGMYRLLDERSRAQSDPTAFAQMLSEDADTGTVRAMRVEHVGRPGSGRVDVRMSVTTRLWGTLHETLSLPMSGSGPSARVRLESSMLFPGLRRGESLSRRVTLATRASLLAADGVVLAQGPHLDSAIPEVAGEVVGHLGPIPPADAATDARLGYPPDAEVGIDGMEQIFQRRLAGRPGGVLYAGTRVLARSAPVAGAPVRTTVQPAEEEAVLAAVANRYSGVVVMNPRTGALEAVTGLAWDAPQPPGSTFKIITSVGLLAAHLATVSTVYPMATQVNIDGDVIHNAANELCGGTLLSAFAQSCNSTYAPLGVTLGATRLVATARRFGFDEAAPFAGADISTIPDAQAMGGPTAVGSSAIGQGEVLATPLEMADVAATIANAGRRPIPTYLAGARPRSVAVTTPAIAADLQKMMIAVITEGTGTPAQIPGVQVAGKTGTAELVDTASTAASANPKNTDSWFLAYAPAGDPKVAVAALFPAAGYGAATAAPVVKAAIEAALH